MSGAPLGSPAVSVSNFVTDATLTVAEALATFPAGAAFRGRYVRVSDLFGYVDGVMRCGFDGETYFWQPTTPEYGRSMAVTGDIALNPLTSPTSVILTGVIGLGTTRNISLGVVNGRPGEIKEIKMGLTTLLGTLNILGTGLGSGLSVLLGDYRKFVLDRSGGTLQWIRLI